MTIKEWVKKQTQEMLAQARPGTSCPGLDEWIKYEDAIIEEITFLYNNDGCWNQIDEDDKHQIVNKILEELNNE